jgi:hypothetical protein
MELAGAQNADVHHVVCTIMIWGVALIWRLCGGSSDHQETCKQENRSAARTINQPSKIYAACKRLAQNCAVSHSKGDCGNNLGASWRGQKSKIAANDIVEATQ